MKIKTSFKIDVKAPDQKISQSSHRMTWYIKIISFLNAIMVCLIKKQIFTYLFKDFIK